MGEQLTRGRRPDTTSGRQVSKTPQQKCLDDNNGDDDDDDDDDYNDDE